MKVLSRRTSVLRLLLIVTIHTGLVFAIVFVARALFSPQGRRSPDKPATEKASALETLQEEIEALKAPKVAWRAIPWKSCLLDGLRESRSRNKPILLWVFIDRPVDDARC